MKNNPLSYFDIGRRAIPGEIGIEIEMEGSRLPQIDTAFWRTVSDGSLRGESFEYVSQNPIPFSEAQEALDELWGEFRRWEARLTPSHRCGVHVHVNCQRYNFLQIYTFACLYMVFEIPLVRWCGPDRECNLFCLRAKDAEALVLAMADARRVENFTHLCSDVFRYSGINFSALRKYGSLEFRSMRTTDNPEDVLNWVRLIRCIKDTAEKYSSPEAIVENFSKLGAEKFFEDTFGDLHRMLIYPGIINDITDSLRIIQSIAYAKQWKKVKYNPYEDASNSAELNFLEQIRASPSTFTVSPTPRPAPRRRVFTDMRLPGDMFSRVFGSDSHPELPVIPASNLSLTTVNEEL